MSARSILTKFCHEALRKQGKSLDGRIAEKVYAAFGAKVSRKQAWLWLAKEMERQGKLTPSLPVPKKKKRWDKFARSDAQDFYNSREWRACRFEALKAGNGRCNLCGRSNREHGIVLHVDHIKPRSKAPHLALVVSNLQVLCEDCNLGKSNRDDTDWRPNA